MPEPLTAAPADRPGSGDRSRLAGIAPPAARRLLAAIVLLLLIVAWAAGSAPVAREGQSAATIHAGLTSAVASGGDYYLAAVEALRAADRGVDPVAVRLPTLGILATLLPGAVLMTLAGLLALGVVALWYRRLAGTTSPIAAALLPLAGTLAVLRPGAVLVQESWAGLLIALSLAVARPGRSVEAVALGLAAALIDQGAAIYLLVMAVLAAGRRERLGWIAGMALFGIVFAVHAHAVLRAGGEALAGGSEMAGPAAAIRAVADAAFLGWVPVWCGAALVVLATLGWAVPPGGAARRIGAVLLALGVVVAIRSYADVDDAAMLVAPLSLVGLALAVPALRRLVVVALDRRRITVTRIVR